jgi:hypothetical protein
MSMSDHDHEQIAEAVARKLGAHECPLGMDLDTIATLKDLATTWRTSKKAMLTTLIGLIVVGTVGTFLAGFVGKIKGVIP